MGKKVARKMLMKLTPGPQSCPQFYAMKLTKDREREI